jgi:hypothetical protein
MKKYIYLLIAALLTNFYPPYSYAQVLKKYNKVIWINQEEQAGAAYGQGKMLLEFPILTGDDETPTPPGTYVIKSKVRHYHSRKYNVPMPYSLFFDYRGRAIHEGDVAAPGEKSEWATHGCIHVEQPYMEWLYNWAEAGKTVVVVKGRRVWEDGESKVEKEVIGENEVIEDKEEIEEREGIEDSGENEN